MRKNKIYNDVRFSVETLREAINVLRTQVLRTQTDTSDGSEWRFSMRVEIDDADWKHDSEEEFFSDYRRSSGSAWYRLESPDRTTELEYHVYCAVCEVTVQAPDRGRIESVFEIFERNVDASRLAQPKKPHPRVFIGHGRDSQWRDLKDHLHEKHDYQVEAYEVGARTGHAIRYILEDMLSKTSFAVLVLTGEDETSDGGSRARQNVIHETGLFQGRLGFNRAIILLEDGTDEFSNIKGIHQIRFGKNNIKETFGEVLATLRREFAEDSA